MLGRVLLVFRTLLAHYRHHPAQGIFLLTGLSLGVSILLGTLIVSEAAKASFAQAQQTINSNVVATIIPANGRRTIPEDLYVQLRRSGYTHLLPQVEERVQLKNGKFVTMRGLDAFALLQSTSEDIKSNDTDNLQTPYSLIQFSFEPYESLVSQTLASVHGLANGDTITLADGQTLPPLKIVNNDLGTGYSVVCDLRCAQEILNFERQLTSIAVTRMPKDIDAFTAALPEQVKLIIPRKNGQNRAMSDAFFLNITAVSLLAFLVGCFIAFNAVRFSVIQRTPLVQQLRMTGVTFTEVSRALVLELLLWAFLASLVGSLLGWLIADALLPSVGLTLNQLFQGKNLLFIPELQKWWSYALLISFGGTLVAVSQPFWQLAKRRPIQSTQLKPGRYRLEWLGITLLVLGLLLTYLPRSQTLGFIVTFCWFLGGALLVPGIAVRLYTLIGRNKRLGVYPKIQWLMADGQFNHARLSVAMMAFAVAIAAGIAVSTMVTSFQTALERYLDQVLAEDLYLQPNHQHTQQIYQFLSQHPEVQLAYRFYHTTAKMAHGNKSFASFVRGLTDDAIRHQSISLEQQVDDIWAKLHRREGVVINQTLAFHQQLKIGDVISIKQKDRITNVEVLGVYHSYGATVSSIIISQEWLASLWPSVDTVEVGVFLHPDKDIDALIEQLQSRFDVKSHQAIKPGTIKALALKIFGQTFEATKLLSLLTLIIAAVGIYCACFAAQLDQQRQLTLLKVLGIDHNSITKLCTAQLLFNTSVAAIIAIPMGLAIAWASVHIVLQYSFGWYFDIIVDIPMILTIVLTAILVALLAGVIPLYRLSKRTAIEAFREAT